MSTNGKIRSLRDYLINTRLRVGRDNYANAIVEHLNKTRKEGLLCDVILRSGSQEVYAHCVVVSRLSKYFFMLLKYEGGFGKPAIEFDDNIITGECLKHIVEYAYTGEIDISNDNLMDLLLAADYLDIQTINEQCESFILTLDNDNILTKDNLKYFVWFAYHLNVASLQNLVCKFISKRFIQLKDTLLSLSPYCLFSVLTDKDLGVCDHGIPVLDVDLEIFQFFIEFIAQKEFQEEEIIVLLDTIDFAKIPYDIVVSIIKSYPVMKYNELLCRLSMLRLMPFYISVNQKLPRMIKYLDGESPNIDIDDRVCRIKWQQYQRKDNFQLIDGWDLNIELTYNSGKIVTIGDMSQKLGLPYESKCWDECFLSKNEVIVKIFLNGGMLSFIKIVTNLGNEFCSMGQVRKPRCLYEYHPETEFGYFHSFEPSSNIFDLYPVWVEYKDKSQNVDPHLRC